MRLISTASARNRSVPGAAVLAVVVAFLAGCSGIDVSTTATTTTAPATPAVSTAPAPTTPQPPSPQPSAGPGDPTDAAAAVTAGATDAATAPLPTRKRIALRRLATLRDVPRQPTVPPYRRDAFGGRWVDVDGNGCNQRDDVLLRDAVAHSVTVQWQGRCDHDVLAGTWIDPYTGQTLVFDDLKNLKQAQAIQIDHVVALAEAWRSGASTWSDEQRRLFANDLDNLLAVDGPTNIRKRDDDPAAWRPRKAYQCEYAIRWIRVKHTWDLGADRSETAALRDMLDYC